MFCLCNKKIEQLEKRIDSLEINNRIPDPSYPNYPSANIQFAGFYYSIFTPLLKKLGYKITYKPQKLIIEEENKNAL